MKRDSLKLYFIALVPPEPVNREIMSLKEEVQDRYNSKAALRSPPHITLHMPFQWKEEKERILIESLDQLANKQSSFGVTLKNFEAFPPRVIYVAVQENEALDDLQKVVQKNAGTNWHIYPKADNRPFQPHMTIAFRDLKKPQFFQAWKNYETQDYQASFIASNVCLLKHNGKTWDILHRSPLIRL
jgi:2'-5' RNA ligase